jgi:predicted DNA-binding protein
MKQKRLQNATHFRLDSEVQSRIEKVSNIYGVTKSDLFRNAINRALPEWEREGVRLFPVK